MSASATPATTVSPQVGQPISRPEDVPLMTGEAVFVADVNREGQLHARVVRSQVAHGELRAVDTEAAASRPGVVAVVTAADLPDVTIPIRMPVGDVEALSRALQPPLAVERVRYVGEPVAVVVARDAATAEDAAAEVFADIDDSDVVLGAGAAAAEGAPVLHPVVESNVVSALRWRAGDDVEELLSRADVVVRESVAVQRHTGVPLETRGLVAEFDAASGKLTVWGAAKVKFFNRGAMAAMLGIDEASLNLVECEVGGAFGVRGELYPEDFLIPWLALRLKRPVKWIEDRIEHMVAANHSREQEHVLEIAATSDGRLLGLRDRGHVNLGAYVRTHGALVPATTGWHLPGPLVWQGLDVEEQLVLTNKTPAGTYRGPGGTEAAFVRERVLDRLAKRLAIDPAELRRRNLIPADRMPYGVEYTEGFGSFVHEEGDYPRLWDALLERAGYEELRNRTEQRRAAGELCGVGTACFSEHAAIGPFEEARITAEPDGSFTVAVGVSSVGQGLRTVLAQVAADALDVPVERIVIDYVSTDSTPKGFGTFASRATIFAGNAIALAAEDLLRNGGTTGTGRFAKEGLNVGFGGAVAAVAVDSATGMVTVERLVVGVDTGRVINPKLAEGQLVGAAAQGIGGALLEEFVYDEYGQPLATTFADYLMPTASDLPVIEAMTMDEPLESNPLGIGPVGEGGIYGVLPAVANAVADAVGEHDELLRLPLSPERVWRILNEERAA